MITIRLFIALAMLLTSAASYSACSRPAATATPQERASYILANASYVGLGMIKAINKQRTQEVIFPLIMFKGENRFELTLKVIPNKNGYVDFSSVSQIDHGKIGDIVSFALVNVNGVLARSECATSELSSPGSEGALAYLLTMRH